jgi:hypothetical protein
MAMSLDRGSFRSSSGESGTSPGRVGVNGVVADNGSRIEGVAGVGGSSDAILSEIKSVTNHACGSSLSQAQNK